jgi:TRAP-type mannitol/chloroaromatic compound transport system permease small subunit
MVAYYMLGGPYSLQLDSNVRMDLLYGSWPDRQKAWVDAFSVFALLFYLGVLLYGAVESTAYSLEYTERSPTAWRPYIAPIKIIMSIGILLMTLQAIAIFFRDVAKLRGEEI